MPHQCVKCGALYDDGAEELLKGCSGCTGKFFFFIKKENLEQAKQLTANLSDDDKRQMEVDVLELVGEKIGRDAPVVLDLEAIKVSGPGKYEIDLVDLFKGKPLVYKLDDGKYIIDIVSTFNSKEKKLEEKNKKVKGKN